MIARIVVFFTGGTISMRVDPVSGGPVPALSGAEILRSVPDAGEIATLESVDFGLHPGPHMTPSRMWALREQVRRAFDRKEIDGVVITHGTDTLEETAYLLELTLDSSRPVVFAGAMRNSSEPGWDGPANLRAALPVAANPSSANHGVLIVLNDRILSATDGTKTHTQALDTFHARDWGPRGMVTRERILMSPHPASREHFPTERLEESVEIIQLAAGSDGRLIDLAIAEGARGVIVQGLGCGNVPPIALKAVERAVRSCVPVIITTRCWQGRVSDVYAYEGSGRDLVRAGAILGSNLPSHKARIKLMVLLGQGASIEAIRKAFGNDPAPNSRDPELSALTLGSKRLVSGA